MNNRNPSSNYQDLYAASFAVDELNLYLDTHPNDCEALEAFRIAREKEIRAESAFIQSGRDLTAGDIVNCERWTWVDGPFPWEGV